MTFEELFPIDEVRRSLDRYRSYDVRIGGCRFTVYFAFSSTKKYPDGLRVTVELPMSHNNDEWRISQWLLAMNLTLLGEKLDGSWPDRPIYPDAATSPEDEVLEPRRPARSATFLGNTLTEAYAEMSSALRDEVRALSAHSRDVEAFLSA